MEVSLREHRLWGYASGKFSPPKSKKGETKDDFALHLEDWDNIHCKIVC